MEVVFRPFNILLRRRCVPSIKNAELDGTMISLSSLDLFALFCDDGIEWIHAPRAAVSTKSEETCNVVSEDEGDEVPAVHETGGLEDLFVLKGTTFGIRRGRVRPCAALIEFEEHVGDVLNDMREIGCEE